jgi:hypothetical protein
MRNDLLHVYTARFNPLRYEQPQQHFKDWVEHMLDCGVKVHVAEVQYGERPFECDLPHVDHLGLRASTPAWAKEPGFARWIEVTPPKGLENLAKTWIPTFTRCPAHFLRFRLGKALK